MTYYSEHADSYFEHSVSVDMEPLYAKFLPILPSNSHILDAGCGSGRDAKAFIEKGFQVTAIDASADMASLASQYIGQSVEVMRFQDVEFRAQFEGVWACASLLHVPQHEMPLALRNLWRALKPNGIFYCSFKYGTGERSDGERHFTDADEIRLKAWLSGLSGSEILDLWITEDQRASTEGRWANALLLNTKKHHASF